MKMKKTQSQAQDPKSGGGKQAAPKPTAMKAGARGKPTKGKRNMGSGMC